MAEKPHCFSRLTPDDTAKDAADLITPDQRGLLSPWLGLTSRLVLSPISVALVSLIFVGMRLVLSSTDVSRSVATARSRFLSACTEAEAAASLAASLPHFLAASTNAEISKSITSSVRGAGQLALLGITAVEHIMSYFVESYKSLFLCFMELLVRGSLAVVISAVQMASDAVHAAAQTIRVAIQESIQGVNSVLSSAVSGVNDIIGVFGQSITAPTIDVPSLNALDNIALPTAIQDSLMSLNSSLPTLADLKQKLDNLMQSPLESMRAEINTTTSAFTFNTTLLSTPNVQSITFCDKIDTTPLDRMEQDLHHFVRVGMGLLAALAVILMAVCAVAEWCGWRNKLRHVDYTRQAYLRQRSSSDGDLKTSEPEPALHNKGGVLEAHKLMSLLEVSQRPLLTLSALKVCRQLGIRSPAAKARVSWFLCFVSFPAAVACLLAGLVGLLSVYGQIYAIDKVSSHYEHEMSMSLHDMSSSVADLVNSHMRNASEEFASNTNAVINGVQDDLNTHLFGWVNITTTTMNDTLNEFLDGITGTLSTTFGKTPFEAPMQTFVNCIVGQKVKGIEQALTWIHDNAHVNLTRVPDDVLMISTEAQAQLVEPIQDLMLGDTTSGQPGLISSITDRYRDHLRKELVMFWALIGVYALVFLSGLFVVAYATVYDRKRDHKASHSGEISQLKPQRSVWAVQKNTFGRVSPFGRPSSLKSLVPSSDKSHTPRIGKYADISYPVQIIRRTHDDVPAAVEPTSPAQGGRKSWLSFLYHASSSIDMSSRAERGSNEVSEDADTRFERLFGCSPIASPTSAQFVAAPAGIEQSYPRPHSHLPSHDAEVPLTRGTSLSEPLTRSISELHPFPHRSSHQQSHVTSPSTFVFHAW